MKVQVLIQVEITNININKVMQEFPTLRMYLQWFPRTKNGKFISEATVIREEGKKDILKRDSIELRNSLYDWSFNENYKDNSEEGDAYRFFIENPKGFEFKFFKICDL